MQITDPLPSATHQRGASLVVALVFLLILTVIGVTAMSTSTLDEKMAGNLKDRFVAFQTAESTLRDAEQAIKLNSYGASSFTSACTNGLCLPSTSDPVWLASTNWSVARPYGSVTGAPALPDVVTPQYLIEDVKDPTGGQGSAGSLGTGFGPAAPLAASNYYRITARSTGASGKAEVMLQEIYAK